MKQAEQANENAKDALRLTQRARVGAEKFLRFPLTVGLVPLEIRVINTGVLPATNMGAICDYGILDKPLAPGFPIEAEGEPLSLAMLPHGPGLIIPIAKVLLTERDVADIQSGKAFLYAWGILDYDDGFGTVRHTRFCAIHERDTDSFLFAPHDNYAE